MLLYLRPILNDRDKEGKEKWRISVKPLNKQKKELNYENN